ncbi:MAG: dihydrolipoyl dehydrogenase [Firmicutes bacterium]|nr:dihydrolipoyl dehydrogenase [Bacillota bacterium]
MKYDVAIIGGGGGGYPAAFRLAQSGRTVLLIDEKGNLGGNCLYEGCVPSKAVREATVAWHAASRLDYFGLSVNRVAAPWQNIRDYKDGVQTRRYQQHAAEIREASRLTVVRGRARFVDARRLAVEDWEHDTTFTTEADDIIVATGSEAVLPPIPGLEQAWTHHQLFAWRDAVGQLPESLIIIGGGYIGVETASMLSDLGVAVTLVELAPTLLPTMDPDLVHLVSEALAQRVTVLTGVRVDRVDGQPGAMTVRGHRLADQSPVTLQAAEVLAALGRQPHLPQDLGLDRAGIQYTPHGILVDEKMRTNVPHIYAAGDVTGLSMLFHSAVRMSEIAARAILSEGEDPDRFIPEEMPTTVFSRPELFSVGLTRAMAEARGMRVEEFTRPMGVEAWAQIRGELEGQLKVVLRRADGRIVGIHGVGVSSVELSAAAHMAVRLGLTARELAAMTFPHPTQFEALDRLARSI